MCIIRLGGQDAEFLVLQLRGRTRPESLDYWDGNWLSCRAEAAAGAFQANVENTLRNEELARFLRGLEQLYERLTGEALFETLEGWVSVRIKGDGRGHLEARCQLCDDPMWGNTLAFRLFFDQTSLPPLMEQIRKALEVFPVVGRS